MSTTIDIPNARPLYIPVPTQQDPDSGRIILKDGSSANLRSAQSDDFQAMREFNHRLSIESLQFRFFSNQEPDDDVVKQLCESADPTDHMTLIVEREVEHQSVIIGYGVYAKCTPKIAEFSVAVYDEYQGLGIGAVLLDRLAMVALTQGFETFRAIASAVNHRMLTVFRHSGYSVDTVVSDGYAEIDLNIMPTPSSIERSDSRDRHFAKASLEKFFSPNGVLFIGDINRSDSVASRVYQNIRESYSGCIEAHGLSTKSVIADLHEGDSVAELAVLVVPAADVEELIEPLAKRGVQALCMISVDGSDPDAEAKTELVALSAALRKQGIRLIGSQSCGFLTTRPDQCLNASLSYRSPKSGSTAIASQSGSIGMAMIDLARDRSLGIADFVSMGAKLDISGNDLLQYWADDEAVNCILLYLESFGNPRRFVHLARKVSRQKPILVMKSGYRDRVQYEGGHLLTSQVITAQQSMDALFEQSGVVRVNTLEEMFYAAAGFSRQPAPRGNRVAIISNAYGPGLLCGDACRVSGMKMPPPSHPLREALEAVHLDIRFAEEGFHLPVDLEPAGMQQVLSLLLGDSAYDSVIFLHSGLGSFDQTTLREAVVAGVRSGRKSSRGYFKPILLCLMGHEQPVPELLCDDERIPNFPYPETAARVLTHMFQYHLWRSQPEGEVLDFPDVDPQSVRAICDKALAESDTGWLDVVDTQQVLKAFGLSFPSFRVAQTWEETESAAQQLGYPVVLKLSSSELLRKSDRAGVFLNLNHEEDLREAFESLKFLKNNLKHPETAALMVQKMMPRGIEIQCGLSEDPLFGPVLMFGLGGVHSEVLHDHTFRLTPITHLEARSMVRAIRGYRLLQGYDGSEPADIDALENLLMRLSLLAETVPQICEIDCNPILAYGDGEGCSILDCRIRVRAIKPFQPRRFSFYNPRSPAE